MSFTIYTISDCRWCDKALDLLLDRDETIHMMNIENNETVKKQILEYLETIKKRPTFPQVFCDGTYIGGYTDLQEWFKDD